DFSRGEEGGQRGIEFSVISFQSSVWGKGEDRAEDEGGRQAGVGRRFGKARLEKRNSKNGRRAKTRWWCQDPSTPCRIVRGTPVGMTKRKKGKPKTQAKNRTWGTRREDEFSVVSLSFQCGGEEVES